MFESQPADDPSAPRVTRRVFLSTLIAAGGGVTLLTIRHPHGAFAGDATSSPGGPIVIVLFSDDGKRLRKVTTPKVVKSASEWQKQLPPNVYDIAASPTRRSPTPAACGTSIDAVSIAASAATLRCSART